MKGSRTIIYNALLLLILILTQFGVFGTDNPAPGEGQVGMASDAIVIIISFAATVGNAVLRLFTNTTVFEKE